MFDIKNLKQKVMQWNQSFSRCAVTLICTTSTHTHAHTNPLIHSSCVTVKWHLPPPFISVCLVKQIKTNQTKNDKQRCVGKLQWKEAVNGREPEWMCIVMQPCMSQHNVQGIGLALLYWHAVYPRKMQNNLHKYRLEKASVTHANNIPSQPGGYGWQGGGAEGVTTHTHTGVAAS